MKEEVKHNEKKVREAGELGKEQTATTANILRYRNMEYLMSTGQNMLHEFMHTGIATGGVEPHIIDGHVARIPPDEVTGHTDPKAYGAPKLYSWPIEKMAAQLGRRPTPTATQFLLVPSGRLLYPSQDIAT